LKKFLFGVFMVISNYVFSQELANKMSNTIIIMSSEDDTSNLIIYADPTHLDCDTSCFETVISAIVKPTSKKNVYMSEDGSIRCTEKTNGYKIEILKQVPCCFIRPGFYKYLPPRM